MKTSRVPALADVPDGVLTRVEWVLRGGAHEPPRVGSEPAGAAIYGWTFTVALDAGVVVACVRPTAGRRCLRLPLPAVRKEIARRERMERR